mgnify:CR=1 FL=1
MQVTLLEIELSKKEIKCFGSQIRSNLDVDLIDVHIFFLFTNTYLKWLNDPKINEYKKRVIKFSTWYKIIMGAGCLGPKKRHTEVYLEIINDIH